MARTARADCPLPVGFISVAIDEDTCIECYPPPFSDRLGTGHGGVNWTLIIEPCEAQICLRVRKMVKWRH